MPERSLPGRFSGPQPPQHAPGRADIWPARVAPARSRRARHNARSSRPRPPGGATALPADRRQRPRPPARGRTLGQGGQMICAAAPRQQFGVRWAEPDGAAAYGAGGSWHRSAAWVRRTRTAHWACWSTFRRTPPTWGRDPWTPRLPSTMASACPSVSDVEDGSAARATMAWIVTCGRDRAPSSGAAESDGRPPPPMGDPHDPRCPEGVRDVAPDTSASTFVCRDN